MVACRASELKGESVHSFPIKHRLNLLISSGSNSSTATTTSRSFPTSYNLVALSIGHVPPVIPAPKRENQKQEKHLKKRQNLQKKTTDGKKDATIGEMHENNLDHLGRTNTRNHWVPTQSTTKQSRLQFTKQQYHVKL